MSVIENLKSLIAQMSVSEKTMALHLLADSFEAPQTPVRAKAEKKTPGAPKRPSTAAWHAFIKHCKTTQPALFADAKKESEKRAICLSIKEKDLPAYEAWVGEWNASHSDSDSESVIVVSDSEETSNADPDLLKMNCQELRDTWAPLVGKVTGLKSSGKLNTRQKLIDAIMVLRAEKVEIKVEPIDYASSVTGPVPSMERPVMTLPARKLSHPKKCV